MFEFLLVKGSKVFVFPHIIRYVRLLTLVFFDCVLGGRIVPSSWLSSQ